MTVAAYVVHATTGRARLRLPSVKGDDRFFGRLRDELRRLAGVEDVHVNALTGSVLVRYSGDFAAIARDAHEHDLFDVEAPPATADAEPPPSPTAARATEHVRAFLVRTDGMIRRRTKGAVDLRLVTFAALVSGSAYQLARGNFLPAGGTMLVQAMNVLFGRIEDEE